MTSPTPTTRLHITPFNSELLPLVLPASIRPLATDVSFHGIPTFPENNYGYVTLPTMEADKVKKKLNGSILKGRKFKVEAARPQKQQANEEEHPVDTPDAKPSSSKKSKKRKAEDNVLDGYELPSDRKVKRGWTESTDDKTERRKKEKRSKDKEDKKSKSQVKSKYTEKAECLFRTKLPANKLSSADEKSKKQSKKNKAPQETVIHEFAQTFTQPTFLRSAEGDNSLTSTFEEGKGWVDESGNVKEPTSEKARKHQYRPGQIPGHKEKPKQGKVKSDRKAEKSLKHQPKDKSGAKLKEAQSSESEDWTSSSGSSSEDDSTDDESNDSASSTSSNSPDEVDASDVDSSIRKQHQLSTSDDSGGDDEESAEESSSSSEEGSVKPVIQSHATEVHPLEALFKRPAAEKKPDVEPPTQFSFFGQEDADSEDETSKILAPLTPFTKRDLQDRGLRSAAPTPDTSHVSRTINWNPPEPTEQSEIQSYTDSPVLKSSTAAKEDSDFTKWFWENRGDNNRAWKKRRRDAAKELRQRENRRKGMKGKS
ncbi:hypothetical protein BJY04DRAFT_184010 [Aspergillus karnatakaensis]|uniref:uncharacterized protein n=1 Tax=Aspergillus karnatakaensis TaxID=1810916 RepID=UPI003CCD5E86